MTYKALVLGLVMLFIFGGIVPLILAPFAVEQENYDGYLSPIINFVQNGITFNLPSFFFFGDDLTWSLNPFSIFGNFQVFVLSQLQGFSVIPAVVGIPLLILTSVSIIYGVVKIFPFG